MTPEEKAVIQAAIEWRTAIPGHDIHQVLALQEATWSLITSCPQCNQGGHTCPGDGNSIAHGEADCGQHDDCSSEHGIGHDTCPKCWVRKNGGPRSTWKPATFSDLLPGDRARIGQEETTVTRVSRDQWHAKDRQWVDDNGKVRDHMTPWEHEELRIDFTVNPGMRVYPPDVECEILCDAERAALLLLQRGFPGTEKL